MRKPARWRRRCICPRRSSTGPPASVSPVFEYRATTIRPSSAWNTRWPRWKAARARCLRLRHGGRSRRVLQSLPAGAHVVMPRRHLSRLSRARERISAAAGASSVASVDISDLDAVAAALHAEHALLWLETPSNPLMKIVRYRGVGRGSRTRPARSRWCDNTFATPLPAATAGARRRRRACTPRPNISAATAT